MMTRLNILTHMILLLDLADNVRKYDLFNQSFLICTLILKQSTTLKATDATVDLII